MDRMDRARLIADLSTVCAIPVTPFGPSGEVDWAAYGAVVERIVEGGVTVVTPNGNTGEFYALSAAECDRAVEVTAEALARVGPGSGGAADRLAGPGKGGAGVLLMPGVGLDVATAVARGRAAARAGARAVMVHQPVHPYQSAEGWVAYHLAIAEGLPDLGIVPYVRDPSVTPAMLARLTGASNVVGVKYAVPNPLQFASTVVAVAGANGGQADGQAGGEPSLAWVCGLAEGWAPFFWPGGAVGFTSGLVNLVAGPSMDLLAALRTGDYPGAMAIWRRVKPFEDLRARRSAANNVPVVKEALAQLGVCGRAVRPPIEVVPQAEREEVASLLASLGVAARTPAGAAV